MNYTARYGLDFNPFLKNSKEILVDTSEYRETRFRLDYLVKTRGFGSSYRRQKHLRCNSIDSERLHKIF